MLENAMFGKKIVTFKSKAPIQTGMGGIAK